MKFYYIFPFLFFSTALNAQCKTTNYNNLFVKTNPCLILPSEYHYLNNEIFSFYLSEKILSVDESTSLCFQFFCAGINPRNFHFYIYNKQGKIIFSTDNLYFIGSVKINEKPLFIGHCIWLAEFYDFKAQKHFKSGVISFTN